MPYVVAGDMEVSPGDLRARRDARGTGLRASPLIRGAVAASSTLQWVSVNMTHTA